MDKLQNLPKEKFNKILRLNTRLIAGPSRAAGEVTKETVSEKNSSTAICSEI